jgi:Mn2+/Fe2+ NRAMP family transporter
VIGSLITVFAASIMMAVVASAFTGTPLHGTFTNAGGVATGLQHYVGRAAGAIFAIILLNASIIGAASVTLATSYAFGDAFGAHHSLHRSWRDAKFFYGAFTGMVVLAAGIVIIPGAPLGLITTSVQALAGVLLPSATVFLLLLCNDKQVLGPWINRPWLNVLATGIVSILLMMSLILMVTTVFPHINVSRVAVVLGAVLVVVWAVAGVFPSRWCRCPAGPPGGCRPSISWRVPRGRGVGWSRCTYSGATWWWRS